MSSSGMSRRVALVQTDISEVLSASFIRVTRIDELGTMLAVTSNRRTLRRNMSYNVLTRATRRNIPEVAILHSHRSENLKSYKTKPNFIRSSFHSVLPKTMMNRLRDDKKVPEIRREFRRKEFCKFATSTQLNFKEQFSEN
jgi:hypothetical protein